MCMTNIFALDSWIGSDPVKKNPATSPEQISAAFSDVSSQKVITKPVLILRYSEEEQKTFTRLLFGCTQRKQKRI